MKHLQQVQKTRRIIGVDSGESKSGMVVLDGSNIISASIEVNQPDFYNKITSFLLHPNTIVVFEDLAAYSLRLTPQVIGTAKFIGEAVYRLKAEAGVCVELVPRSLVKKWCFDTFPDVCLPIIDKRIKKMDYRNKEGKLRKGSFVYVNDKIVTECMKDLYKIPLPPAGKGYLHGLREHSWQALGVASYFSFNNREH